MLLRRPSQRSTMRTYSQLTQEQRYQIYALKKTKHSLSEMAAAIEVHKSSVSRELKRNRGQRGYRPQQAHELASGRRPDESSRIQSSNLLSRIRPIHGPARRLLWPQPAQRRLRSHLLAEERRHDRLLGRYRRAAPGTFTQLSAGDAHVCAIRTDGTLECWGDNSQGQSASQGATTFTQVSAGMAHTCAVQTSGNVSCWGSNIQFQMTGMPGGTEYFMHVSAGGFHSCGLHTDGSVNCWGGNISSTPWWDSNQCSAQRSSLGKNG